MILLKGKGTEPDPYLIDDWDYAAIKSFLDTGELKVERAVNPDEQVRIQRSYRYKILNEYPQLFDHACLKVVAPHQTGKLVV